MNINDYSSMNKTASRHWDHHRPHGHDDNEYDGCEVNSATAAAVGWSVCRPRRTPMTRGWWLCTCGTSAWSRL